MKKKFIPNFSILDEEEREIARLDPAAVLPEADKLAAVEEFHRAAAGGRSKVISLRFDADLLERIRQSAQAQGLPYQTFIQSIVHRYVNGALLDKSAVQEVVKALS
jgi:predicted DNA binding CopG/RHH family protein